MQAASVFPALREIWKVALWKYEPDASARWWQKAFYHHVFIRFIRLSFKYVKIPPPKGVIIEGGKVTLFWFEDIGNYETEDQADIACLTENHGYKAQPFGLTMPDISAQYAGDLTFPRRNQPRPRPKPTLDLVIRPRRQEDEVRDAISKLNQVLDV